MKRQIARSAAAVCIVLAAAPAWAVWSAYEYRNDDGEHRWGVRNASDHIELNQKTKKGARKVAKKLNKAESMEEGFLPTDEGPCADPASGVLC